MGLCRRLRPASGDPVLLLCPHCHCAGCRVARDPGGFFSRGGCDADSASPPVVGLSGNRGGAETARERGEFTFSFPDLSPSPDPGPPGHSEVASRRGLGRAVWVAGHSSCHPQTLSGSVHSVPRHRDGPTCEFGVHWAPSPGHQPLRPGAFWLLAGRVASAQAGPLSPAAPCCPSPAWVVLWLPRPLPAPNPAWLQEPHGAVPSGLSEAQRPSVLSPVVPPAGTPQTAQAPPGSPARTAAPPAGQFCRSRALF